MAITITNHNHDQHDHDLCGNVFCSPQYPTCHTAYTLILNTNTTTMTIFTMTTYTMTIFTKTFLTMTTMSRRRDGKRNRAK